MPPHTQQQYGNGLVVVVVVDAVVVVVVVSVAPRQALNSPSAKEAGTCHVPDMQPPEVGGPATEIEAATGHAPQHVAHLPRLQQPAASSSSVPSGGSQRYWPLEIGNTCGQEDPWDSPAHALSKRKLLVESLKVRLPVRFPS